MVSVYYWEDVRVSFPVNAQPISLLRLIVHGNNGLALRDKGKLSGSSLNLPVSIPAIKSCNRFNATMRIGFGYISPDSKMLHIKLKKAS